MFALIEQESSQRLPVSAGWEAAFHKGPLVSEGEAFQQPELIVEGSHR